MKKISTELQDWRVTHGEAADDVAVHKIEIEARTDGISIDVDAGDPEKGVSLMCEFDEGRLKIIVAPADGGDATATVVVGPDGILVRPAAGPVGWHRVNAQDGVRELPLPAHAPVGEALAEGRSRGPKAG